MQIYEEIISRSKDQTDPDYPLIQQVIDYYEKIISCMPGNVYWLDKDCRAVGCNKNVLDLFCLKKPEDFRGLTFEQQTQLGQWSSEQGASFKEDTEAVIRTGIEKANKEEPPIPKPNGQNIYFLTSRVPLFNKKGDVIGVVGISIDITEHKRVLEALKKAEGKVDGMMLVSASMAHEFRTPLAGIKSVLFGLQNGLPALIEGYELAVKNQLMTEELSSQYLSSLQAVVANIGKKVDHCNTIIDMLLMNLAHTQISSDDFKPCSIQECIHQALEKYTFTENQKKLLHVNIQKDFYFQGKEILIVHIIFNLLKNAFYFIQKAGKGEIQIWNELGDDQNSLHFKDTGQGIADDSLPHIFDQFFTKETHHGTGIGLAFSKMVMEAHAGSITCDSKYGQYAEFILRFPAIRQ